MKIQIKAKEQAANTAYETAQRRMLESFAKQRVQRLAQAGQDDWCMDNKTQAEHDAEELACFDRAEARAINSGAW